MLCRDYLRPMMPRYNMDTVGTHHGYSEDMDFTLLYPGFYQRSTVREVGGFLIIKKGEVPIRYNTIHFEVS